MMTSANFKVIYS